MEGLIEGRMVHYVTSAGIHLPAILVKVWRTLPDATDDGCSNLQVILDSPEGTMYLKSIMYSEEPRVNTWHWIERA